jgi:hypothetical protein
MDVIRPEQGDEARSDARSPSPPVEATGLLDLVAEAINDIIKMCSQEEIPQETYSGILHILEATFNEKTTEPTAANPSNWSGAAWCRILETSDARSKTKMIYHLSSRMAAAVCFDAQVEAEVESNPPKRGTGEKAATGHVLNGWLNATTMKSSSTNGNDTRPENGLHKIHDLVTDKRRAAIRSSIRDGRKLRRMVEKTHLGILFSRKIW